jgi:hypothetical protein
MSRQASEAFSLGQEAHGRLACVATIVDSGYSTMTKKLMGDEFSAREP